MTPIQRGYLTSMPHAAVTEVNTMDKDRSQGVAATELDDEALRRELEHLWETRKEAFLNGSEDAFEEHTVRMLELEAAFAERFPRDVEPDPERTREGVRAR